MNTLDQQIDYLRKQLGIRDSQVLNDLLNSYSNSQKSLQNQLVMQQQKINKAIEYINELKNFKIKYVMLEEKELYASEKDFVKDLLKILKGEEK